MILDARMHVDDIPPLGWRLEAELCVRGRTGPASTVFHCGDEPLTTPLAAAACAEACPEAAERLALGENALRILERVAA